MTSSSERIWSTGGRGSSVYPDSQSPQVPVHVSPTRACLSPEPSSSPIPSVQPSGAQTKSGVRGATPRPTNVVVIFKLEQVLIDVSMAESIMISTRFYLEDKISHFI